MTNDPDQIRADIEATRRNLGSDVDALADKVDPSKIAQRQADKAKDAVRSVRDRVMGVASDVHDDASSMGDNVAGAAQSAVAKAKGNPLAVGLIAFGAGWLLSSLIPPSEKEKQLTTTLTDAAQPLVDEVKDVASTVADDLKEPAQNAAAAVKDSATDAVDNVKAEASSAVDDVKGQAAESRDNVQTASSN
ncbi:MULTISPECIES: DUF3618 domain-containing protein [unclassified Leifsonia]|uniref:DUF3618 domain-containing protein n=1 Tax=unclassified Leifsonia TaxID=2663824 RepID=UPI0006F3186D|nr:MULTISPECIES: DUF3618 domain-containing protein [unclassified Leifsonia]KQX07618.1 hypothetical protein ASC59_07720 [Leifsonia sp. Root1293]KRA11900.1 hypothetical protein ASD61_07720 [Leifsonia sp. Root60]